MLKYADMIVDHLPVTKEDYIQMTKRLYCGERYDEVMELLKEREAQKNVKK